MNEQGFITFQSDPRVALWAEAAHRVACALAADPAVRSANLRHAETWFVGVDAMPNDASGRIDGVELAGPWDAHVELPDAWHAAQLSIVYPGYPGRDPDESDANHRFRRKRCAAHVDGLLPEGPHKRRFLREPHGFILGLPLNHATAAPLTVWPGSHLVIGPALRDAIADNPPGEVDLTEAYQAARRLVFEKIEPVPVHADPGQAVLLHRHLVHGVAPWAEDASAPPEGRMVAYFRPQVTSQAWLAAD